MESQTTVLPQVAAACELIWGGAHSTENEIGNIFEQWSQGFTFSDDCKSALVQEKGGPCAVIVPAQAYIIKHVLFDRYNSDEPKYTGKVRCSISIC